MKTINLGKTVDLVKVAQWLFATAAVSVSTAVAVVRFAYSDFETQRTTDIYHQQIDKRFEEIGSQLINIDRKVDQILLRRGR